MNRVAVYVAIGVSVWLIFLGGVLAFLTAATRPRVPFPTPERDQ